MSSTSILELFCRVNANVCSKELSREERVLKKQKLGGSGNSNQPQHALFKKRKQELETAKKRAQ
jgi:hypothetical protein